MFCVGVVFRGDGGGLKCLVTRIILEQFFCHNIMWCSILPTFTEYVILIIFELAGIWFAFALEYPNRLWQNHIGRSSLKFKRMFNLH